MFKALLLLFIAPCFAGEAAENPQNSFLLHIHIEGGWDQSLVFDPQAKETDAKVVAMSNNLRYVSHKERPAVDDFFKKHHGDTMILNGIFVSSLDGARSTATEFGFLREAGHWPGVFGELNQGAGLYSHASFLQHHFPLENKRYLQIAWDALKEMSLKKIQYPDHFVSLQNKLYENYFKEKNAKKSPHGGNNGWVASQVEDRINIENKILPLLAQKELQNLSEFNQQVVVALQMMASGIAPAVSVETKVIADRANPDQTESQGFQRFFASLSYALHYGETLKILDKLILVVTSPSGRGPIRDEQGRKLRWPYTSTLLWGKMFRGSTVMGETDEVGRGILLDPLFGTKDMANRLQAITNLSLGAALILKAKGDHKKLLPEGDPLTFILKPR